MPLLLPNPVIGKSGLNVASVFQINLRSGTGASAVISNGFAPDLIISKARNTTLDWGYGDRVSGVGKYLTQTSSSQQPDAASYTAFGTSSYTVGSTVGINGSGGSFIDYVVKEKAGFFDIVTWVGNATVRTIAHSLGVVPGFILIKNKSSAFNWRAYFKSLGSTTYATFQTVTHTTATSFMNNTDPTATDFTVGTDTAVNNNGNVYTAFLFAHDPTGIICQDSYIGNGSTTGPIVNIGWKPQFLIVKKSGSNFALLDAARDPSDPRGTALLMDSSGGETAGVYPWSFNSTGFQPLTSDSGVNQSGVVYHYMAIKAP